MWAATAGATPFRVNLHDSDVGHTRSRGGWTTSSRIPETIDILTPMLASIALQLLAYYIAVKRGSNVDQPRNLAKSVTVE
jgi:glucosamine 6-phosphate synthetase-like amidotransferase/phosphosugar isomerase protein